MKYLLKTGLYLLCCMLLSVGSGVCQPRSDTFHIFFRLNISQLDNNARQAIDSLLYTDAISSTKYSLIVGYADYLGDDSSNIVLSQNRANNVYSYLLAGGMDSSHIRSVMGNGAVGREKPLKGGYPVDRRVDIVTSRDNKILRGNNSTSQIVKRTIEPKSKIGLAIDSLQVGQTFILSNIYFYSGRHTVREECLPELNNLYNVMAENPTLKIRIEGHVCCVPDDKDALDEDVNLDRQYGAEPSPYFLRRLSMNRAMYINYYLVKRGIDSKRLEYEGFGRSMPLIKEEKSMADENKNRRVEIRILEK